LVSIFGARNRSDVHPDVCDFGFWDRPPHPGFAGLAIGLTVGLEALGTNYRGSMNPTRSFGPAFVGEFGSTIGFIGLHQF